MKLFLSGGGSGEDSIELDKKFAKEVGDKPLLYIPIAINRKKHPFRNCLEWISETFNPLGVSKIEMWTEKELREKSEEELNKFGGVYIGGGNTFYLLKELRDSGFIPKLIKLIKNDIPVYGGSAGAVIFAKTILSVLSMDTNEVGLTNFDAMNFVHGYDLWVHYKPKMDREIKQYVNKYGLTVIAVPENAGLHVTEGNIEAIGPGHVRYFNEG